MPNASEDETLNSAPHTQWNDTSHYSCFEENYEAMLKQRDVHRLWFPDNLSGPLLLTNGDESTDCSFRKSTSSAWDCGLMTLMTDGGFMNVENSSPSLHDLCKVWDEECIDLVTRSLKYKSLMTDSNLLRHEVINLANRALELSYLDSSSTFTSSSLIVKPLKFVFLFSYLFIYIF